MFPDAFEVRFPTARVDCFLTWATASQMKEWRDGNQLVTEHLKITEDALGNKTITRYQRSSERKRVRKIRRLLESGRPNSVLPPILPQSIVLNVREDFRVQHRRSHVKLPTTLRFHVVDGQHRVEALEMLNNDIPVPITITRGLSELQEAGLFLLINHTQKKVSASVRLLDIARMLQETRASDADPQSLFEALGLKGADKNVLRAAAAQVLERNHFWFDRVKLPEEEE